MSKLRDSLFCMALVSSAGYAFGSNTRVEMFPTFTINSSGSYADVGLENDISDAIFCNKISALAVFKTNIGDIENPIKVSNVMIWAHETMPVRLGETVTAFVRRGVPEARMASIKDIQSDCYAVGVKTLADVTSEVGVPKSQLAGATRDANFGYVFLNVSVASTYIEFMVMEYQGISGPARHTLVRLNSNGSADVSLAPLQPNTNPLPRGRWPAFVTYQSGGDDHRAILKKLVTLVKDASFIAGNKDTQSASLDVLDAFGKVEDHRAKDLADSNINPSPTGGIMGSLPTDFYLISSVITGKCLNLQVQNLGTSGFSEGDRIAEWDCPGKNSKWTNNYWWLSREANTGQYWVKSYYSGKCMGPANGGNETVQYECGAVGGKTTFDVEDLGYHKFRLINKASGKCVSVKPSGHNTGNGSDLSFVACDGGLQEQSFYIWSAH